MTRERKHQATRERKHQAMTREHQKGQSLVEGTLVMLVFFALLIGVLDVGQVLFAHQSLMERVRAASRWGSLHPDQGPNAVVNYVLYNEPAAPNRTTDGFLGLKPENVQVTFREPTPERPADRTLTVAVVNFETHFFAPWLARAIVSPHPVSITAPIH